MPPPEHPHPPVATRARVQQLITQLARRIQARRMAGAGAAAESSTPEITGPAGNPTVSKAPTAGRIRPAGQHPLLRRLLAERSPHRNVRTGGRSRGRR